MYNILSYQDKLISSMFEERERGALQIFVKLENNIAIKVNKSDKVIDLKWKFYEIIGMTQNEMNLIFQGQILDDERTVEDCEIYEASVVDIIGKLRGGVQIIIKTSDGGSTTIEANNNDSISDLKIKIQEKTGLTPTEQTLAFQGQILEDDQTVEEYQIAEKSVINVVARLRGNMQILAKTMKGKTVSFDVSKKEKISKLKIKIQEKTGLTPKEQKLVFRGGILEDDKTFDDYGIVEKSLIYIVTRLSNGIEIFVKTTDGKIIAFEVSREEKVSDLKKKIQEKTGLYPDEQKLVFQGGILEDDKTVEEYEIVEKSVINVVARLRGAILIFAKTENGKTIAFEVNKNEKISDVKKKIQEKTGLHPDEQKLVFQGGILADDKTVDECGIVERSMIDVFARSPINVLAKTRDGLLHPMKIFSADKIFNLKKMIEEKINIKTNDQYLMYNGGILEDDQSIWDYGICNQSVIEVFCTLRITKMTINIRSMDGQTNQIQVTKNETIASVKERIQEKLGIAKKIHLFYQEDALKDDTKSVDNCGICDQSVIAVIDLP